MEEFHFRFMRLEDVPTVHMLETICFTTPWSEQALSNEITQNQFSYYLVVEGEQGIIAYGGVWIIVDEAHVTNIAVHPDYRGRKLGEALMRKLMVLAKQLNAERMTLEVRRSNHVAQSLYEKLGFKATGVRPRYYTDNYEDAIIMWADLEGVI